jgi:hypothetical protein
MNSSAPITDSAGVIRRLDDEAPAVGDPVAVAKFVARVLRHACRTTLANNAPNDTRAVLYVTHCFADELASANPRFDRLGFVRAVTNSS